MAEEEKKEMYENPTKFMYFRMGIPGPRIRPTLLGEIKPDPNNILYIEQ